MRVLIHIFIRSFQFTAILPALFPGVYGTPISASLPLENFTVPTYVFKHAPLIWLHSADPYMPSDILSHVQHTTPKVDLKPLESYLKLNLDTLGLLNDYGDLGRQVYLTSNDDVTQDPSWLFGKKPDSLGKTHGATPCAVLVVEKNPRDVDAFYFYFYSYDQGANIEQVLPPLDRLLDDTTEGKHFGDHVGDWEHNMVRFRDGVPTGVYFSQHSSGQALDWDDPSLSKEEARPIVFSARGSHANYASTGTHIHDSALLDYCDRGLRWDPIASAYFYSYHPKTDTLIPATSNRSTYPTSWFHFAGVWGDQEYPDSDSRQKTVPYFGLKRFKSGPTGPRAKQLVRKGLVPDKRARKEFIAYAIEAYMAMYGCCFKGYSPWVIVVFFLAVLVLIFYVIRFGVRRFRRRHWRRVRSS